MLKKLTLAICILEAAMAPVSAAEGPIPTGIPHLDHVFVIMMENHGYAQVIKNPSTPYINQLANIANSATNYFAVAHPSLTNYLEVVGGSNFGVQTDNFPAWHNSACTPNLASGTIATYNPPTPDICPIWGMGMDAPTPAIDSTNVTSNGASVLNIDGIQSIPAANNISGKTIADQLAVVGRNWKSYQQDLPAEGPDLVNYSDGHFTNLTDWNVLAPGLPLNQGSVVQMYASKHNPFVYFRSIQENDIPGSGYANVSGFDGPDGLFADLRSGTVPDFSFIAPNQCNDQHGRGNSDITCASDPKDDGTQNGLNPALMRRGDNTLRSLVSAIKQSPVWKQGQNAIVILWDENDYSVAPNNNQVLVIVDTNYGVHGIQSGKRYNHFSLLKSIEAGLGLPCLNHACDADVSVMSDLFASTY